jgi:hypothetical protein
MGGGGRGRQGGRDVVETRAGPAPVNVLIGNPNARGLPVAEPRIDYQDLSTYAEVRATERLSGFVEVPVRFLNPEVNANTSGLADMNAGFKWAFVYTPDRVVTFQLRTYAPTGAASRGLGTHHASLEPALLLYQPLTERLTLQGELRDWIPVGGTDFEGNVLRYGAGLTYRACQGPSWFVDPSVEFVGWTVLDGKETASLGDNIFQVRSAGGDTIVNAKMGVRFGFGESARQSLSVSYGRALTGAVWYKDILRLEYRFIF